MYTENGKFKHQNAEILTQTPNLEAIYIMACVSLFYKFIFFRI